MNGSKRPTNSDLANIVDRGFEAVGERFDKIEQKVATVHDYMIGQKQLQIARAVQFTIRRFLTARYLCS